MAPPRSEAELCTFCDQFARVRPLGSRGIMRLSKTLLWIGALVTASSAIRCGGTTDDSGSTADASGSQDSPSAGSGGGAAQIDGAAGEGELGGSRGEAGRPSAGEGGGAGRAGGAPTDAGAPWVRDAGGIDGRPRDAQAFPPGDGAGSCPVAAPVTNDLCAGTAVCAYAGQVCTCPRSRGEAVSWTCFSAPVTPDASTCPTSAPRANDSCSLQGLSCRYRTQQCFCGGRAHSDDAADGAAWNCR